MMTLQNFVPLLDCLLAKFGPVTAATYGFIWRRSQGERGRCDARRATIGRALGISEKSVYKHTRRLEAAGYITIEERPNASTIFHTTGLAERENEMFAGQDSLPAGGSNLPAAVSKLPAAQVILTDDETHLKETLKKKDSVPSLRDGTARDGKKDKDNDPNPQKHPEIQEVLDAWHDCFPGKRQPGQTSDYGREIAQKIVTRYKDPEWRAYWRAAMEKAASKKYFNARPEGNWFDLTWFVANGRHIFELLDGKFEFREKDFRPAPPSAPQVPSIHKHVNRTMLRLQAEQQQPGGD